jgi:hypothetical protein
LREEATTHREALVLQDFMYLFPRISFLAEVFGIQNTLDGSNKIKTIIAISLYPYQLEDDMPLFDVWIEDFME